MQTVLIYFVTKADIAPISYSYKWTKFESSYHPKYSHKLHGTCTSFMTVVLVLLLFYKYLAHRLERCWQDKMFRWLLLFEPWRGFGGKLPASFLAFNTCCLLSAPPAALMHVLLLCRRACSTGASQRNTHSPEYLQYMLGLSVVLIRGTPLLPLCYP